MYLWDLQSTDHKGFVWSLTSSFKPLSHAQWQWLEELVSSLRDVLFSHKQETQMGVFSWVFMAPSGYELERDIAAGLSSYKQFRSQMLCPKFTATTKHKKQIHQNLTDWEGSVQCSGGDKPWHGPFVAMWGEFWAIFCQESKSFCETFKRWSEDRLFNLWKSNRDDQE